MEWNNKSSYLEFVEQKSYLKIQANLILESIIWQFYFLNAHPFFTRGLFTFLVAVAHGEPGASDCM